MALKAYQHVLNVGVVDADKLHRVDLDHIRMAAAEQTNLIPSTVGPAMFRPGLKYIGATYNGEDSWLVPFVSSEDEAFILEFGDGRVRFRKASDGTLVTRATVTATVPNGLFLTGASWTLNSASGQSSTIAGQYLNLIARAKGAEAYGTNVVAITETGVEHAMNIEVTRGPVTFRLGSTSGAEDLIKETELKTGKHSLAFTPSGANVYIKLSTKDSYLKLVNSCTIDSAGVQAMATPYADADLPNMQVAQSLDVLYIACRGYQRMRIERRADASWSVVNEDSNDGPFVASAPSSAKLTPAGLEGDVVLSSDVAFFTSDMVGSLIMLTHRGQRLDTYLAAADVYSDPIEVQGVNETDYNDRDFTYTLAGTWTATVHVQRSFDSELVGFQEFRRAQSVSTIDITANATYTDDDNEDNAITWYRVGIEAGDYTSGEVHVTLQYGGGQGYGIGRISSFTNATTVSCQVFVPFKGTDATADWRIGLWSDENGWPSAVAFADGRLVWAGDDTFNASISDAYSNFDETFEGDAGPILRSIAVGGRNESRWMLQMPGGLIIGTDGRIVVARANSFDAPMTPTDFKLASISKVGVAPVAPVEMEDNRALFVEKSLTRLYELTYDARYSRYVASPFSKLTTDLFSSGIRQMAVSTLPDQRVWCVMENGTVVVVVYEPDEKVVAFVKMATRDGDRVRSVCVVQDRVWFCVERDINGSTVYHIERLALDSQGKPDDVTVCMDSYVSGTGAHSATITGLSHLEGETVVAWVDGEPVLDENNDPEEFTVASGQITLPAAVTAGYCVGLPYEWAYESGRLEYGLANQAPMMTHKALAGLSVLFADYARSGIRVGTRNADGVLSTMDPLPSLVRGGVPSDVVSGVVPNESTYAVPGGTSVDQRLRITGASPSPATILGLVMEIETRGG